MHEFCCCEALKVFKIIYEKVVKRCKRFNLKGFEKLFKKDLKKKKKKGKPKPLPHPARPNSSFFFFQSAHQTHPAQLNPSAHLTLSSLSLSPIGGAHLLGSSPTSGAPISPMAGHTAPPSRRPLHACAVSPPLHERGIQCAPAPTRRLAPSPPATAAPSPTGHSWRRPPELASTALAAPPLLPSRPYKNSTRTPAPLLMVNFRQPRVLVIHWFRL
jgi:hypothetical protein